MTRTFDGPPARRPGQAGSGPAPKGTRRSTRGERAMVLGGFAIAALWTAATLAFDGGMETAGAAWLAAVAWAVVSSLALALRRGFLGRDWTAFRRHRFPDNGELVDWTTRTGRYAYLRQWEDRILRDDRHLR